MRASRLSRRLAGLLALPAVTLGLLSATPVPRFIAIDIPPITSTRNSLIRIRATSNGTGKYISVIPFFYDYYEAEWTKFTKEITTHDGQIDTFIEFPCSYADGGLTYFNFKLYKEGKFIEQVPIFGRPFNFHSDIVPVDVPDNEEYVYATPEADLNYFDGDLQYYRQEKLIFRGFSSSIVYDLYDRIDLSLLSVRYEGLSYDALINSVELFNPPERAATSRPVKVLRETNCYLLLEDRCGCFSDLGAPRDTGTEVKRKLPLIFLPGEENQPHHLKFKDDMYVDPVTLHMSSTPGPGLIRTEHLYLPVNRFDDFQDLEIMVVLENLGANCLRVRKPITLSFARNYFGDCENSGYCIVSEPSEPELGLSGEDHL